MALDLSQLRRLFGNSSGQRMTMSPSLLELSEEEDERLSRPAFVDKSDVSITTPGPGLLAPELPELGTSPTGIADSDIGRVNQARMRTGEIPLASVSDPGRYEVSSVRQDGVPITTKDGRGFRGGMGFLGGEYQGLLPELQTPSRTNSAGMLIPNDFGFQQETNEGGRAKYFAKYGEMPRGPVDDSGEPLSPEAARDLQRLPEATEEELAITEPALARTRAGLSPFPLPGGLDTSTTGLLGDTEEELAITESLSPTGGLIDEESITADPIFDPTKIRLAGSTDEESITTEETDVGPELPAPDDLTSFADTIRNFESFRTTPYIDWSYKDGEKINTGLAVGLGQHKYWPETGPPVDVTEDMDFTDQEWLDSADRQLKQEVVPGLRKLLPPGKWEELSPEAQAQLVSVAWNYGVNHRDFKGDRPIAVALREGDWDAMGDAIRDLASDNINPDTGQGANYDRRNAEGDAWDAAMAGGDALPGETAYANQTPTSGMLDSFRATLSDIEEQGIASGLIPTDRLAYLTTDERREKLGISLPPKEEGGSWSIPKDGRIQMQIPEGMPDETWDKLTDPSPHAAGIPLVSQAIALLDRINSETVPQSAFPSTAEVTQARKEEETLQRQLDLMRARGATQQEIDAVEADFHTERSGSKKQKQIDEYMALDGDVRAFVEGRWSPADAVDAAVAGIGEELVGEYGGDTSSLLEGIIGDTPPPATGAGAADEAPAGLPADIDEPPAIGKSFEDQLEAQAGLIDSRAISSSAVSGAVPGSQDARPQRRGLLDDRLAIAQALAQLSAGVAQGGLFGDITDTGEVRGGLVNVMPGAIQTLRTAQENATGEDIPDSNWGVGPAKEEQLFYIGPGGSITWVKDNEGNYVLKSSTDGGSGGTKSGEKASMAQALITMTTDAGIDLMDYYINNYNLSSGEMLSADGDDASWWERMGTRTEAGIRDAFGADQTDLPNYGAAKQAAALMGEGFLRMTTGAAYNAQEYGNAMDLFWVKATDSRDKKLFKWKMAAQFGPMMQIMSGIDSKNAMADARINNKKLNAMREMMLKGLAEGKIGGTAEQRTALSVALQLPPETETMEWEDTIGDI